MKATPFASPSRKPSGGPSLTQRNPTGSGGIGSEAAAAAPADALSLRPGDALLQGRAVFATRDWHPPDHGSFQTHGGSWPVHCVAGTRGAELAPGLALPPAAEVISKGTSPNEEAYSGFQGTDLAARLRQRGCRRVFIGGLATEYCVRATALDAVAEGFDVVVLHDAVRAVDVKQGDGECALAQLIARGVRVLSSAQVLE